MKNTDIQESLAFKVKVRQVGYMGTGAGKKGLLLTRQRCPLYLFAHLV